MKKSFGNLKDIEELIQKSQNNHEFTFNEAKELLNFDLNSLGIAANELRKKICGDTVTFIADTTINYTNFCLCGCKFCAFYKKKNDPEMYVLTVDEILDKVNNAVKHGATQVLIQGGLNPDIEIEYYEEIIKQIKEKFPSVQRHFFSAPEIYFIAKENNCSVDEILSRFKEVGLQSIPGGGAEILEDTIRKRIAPNKISFDKWKEVMVKAHKMNLKTSSTMVYGFGENKEARIKHLLMLRDIQKETGGFTAFIPWSYQPKNTKWIKDNPGIEIASGVDYLEVIAVARIIFNNIRNIQCSWLTEGSKLAQVALFYGANDFSGTIIEENVVKAAGVNKGCKTKEEIVRLIRQAGRVPAERDTVYNIKKVYD